MARQVEQLRGCDGDYRQFSAERVQKWLAWWEVNRQCLDLRGPLPRQAYTLVLLVYMGLDPRLRFSRNYAAGLRPYADTCEEQITLLE